MIFVFNKYKRRKSFQNEASDLFLPRKKHKFETDSSPSVTISQLDSDMNIDGIQVSLFLRQVYLNKQKNFKNN